MRLDNQYHTMGGADFHIATTGMIKAAFPVANTGQTFPDSGRTRSPSGCRTPSAPGTAIPPSQPFTRRSTAW